MEDHLDGGYGWVVVFGSFVVHMLVLGVQYSFGIIFAELLEEFNSTRDAVAWVGSLCIGFQLGMGVISGWLIAKFGERRVILAGGVLASIALFLASFAKELYQLYITYGVLLGLAFSWLWPPAIVVVQRWFVKRRALATGIASSGSGIGTMALGPAIAAFVNSLGWRNAFRGMACLPIGVALLAALLCRTPVLSGGEPKRSSSKIVPYWSATDRIPLLRNRSLLLLMLSACIAGLGWMVPPVHVVQYGKDAGVSSEKRPVLVTAMGIGLLIGRVPTCWFADWTGRRIRTFAGVTALIGTTVCLFPLAKSFGTLLPLCVLFGWMAGAFVALTPPVVKEFMTLEELPQAAGLVYTAWGWSLMVGPPIVGFLYQLPEQPSYTMPFVAAGLTTILGASIILFVEVTAKAAPAKSAACGVAQGKGCPDISGETEGPVSACAVGDDAAAARSV